MDKKIEDFVNWYKCERTSHYQIYIDKSSWIKSKLLPYSNWDSSEVLAAEANFTLRALGELRRQEISQEAASLAVLTFSNRAEYISDSADFFVSYAAIMLAFLATVGTALGNLSRLLIGLAIFAGITYSFKNRVDLRMKVAVSKELVNLFKQFESKHSKPIINP